jgi:hypothetical protein
MTHRTLKHIFVLLLFALILPALPAQNLAVEMDAVLESEAVTWAEAARFVLPAAGFLDQNGAGAFQDAKLRGWLPEDAKPGDTADFGGLSFLIMKALDIPGGVMYRLFPGPRYAYRELRYLNILQGQHDRFRKVSGFWLISLIGRALEMRGIEG